MKRLAMLLAVAATYSAAQDRALPLPASGNVTLPLEEYNKLIDQAGRPAKKPEVPPVGYALKRADLRVQVTGNVATGTIQIEGEVYAKGPVVVPLVSAMTVLDARWKGQDVPLRQDGATHAAVLTGPTVFGVTLDIGLPVRTEPGRASVIVPAQTAGVVQLTLAVPGEQTVANLNQGLITSRSSAGGRTNIEATLPHGQPATVWWATRETVAPPPAREVRLLSDVKTLISVNEAELSLAALADITLVSGEPAEITVQVPTGYEVTGASGATLESHEINGTLLTLKVSEPAQRSHQFLISLVRPVSEAKASVVLPAVKGAQRETGEVLVAGQGTMELTATEAGGLKRIDLKETSPYLLSLGHEPPQAAFRYHRQAGAEPAVGLTWLRFPDSSVLAAVAEQAVVTTLVTSEGRSLTEVRLVLRNQAQPFLKVGLPPGAGILSADVAGERVKPVEGPDGNRVPLLRAGFRATGSYPVSFVFQHSGDPFARKGGSELALPRMDVPIGLLAWEVFLPDRYQVRDFGGDAVAANLLPYSDREESLLAPAYNARELASTGLRPGQVGGQVVDVSGSVVTRAQVVVTGPATGFSQSTTTDERGIWSVSGVPSGRIRVTVDSLGFAHWFGDYRYDANSPLSFVAALKPGALTQTVEVTDSAPSINTESAQVSANRGVFGRKKAAAPPPPPTEAAASANVLNLQRRVSGVLPVAVDVPRSGSAYRFVRPLVVDEETRVSFTYKTK